MIKTRHLLEKAVTVAAIAAFSVGGWTSGVNAAEADKSMEEQNFFFAVEKVINTYYQEERSADRDELSIGINTAEGEKGFEENETVLTSSVEDIFVPHEENGEFINDTEGELQLSVSNPKVISLEKTKQTRQTSISADENIAEKKISVYGISEGAAYLYLNEVEGETVTTLGKVEMEVR